MSTHAARWLLALALVASQAGAESQGKGFRIGALTESWGPTPAIVGLRDGLVALGYRENVDFFIGVRFTRGDTAALVAAAEQLVAHGVDLLYANGNPALYAASAASARVPVLCLCDPVALGLADSFARPGGKVTGVTDLDQELGPKRLQLFKELVPGLARVVFPYDALDVEAVLVAKSYREGARRLGLELRAIAIESEEGARALLELDREDVDGLLAPRLVGRNIPALMLEVAKRERIPTMFPGGMFWLEEGALASYGPDWHESGRIAARLAQKILEGAEPGSIPLEVNSVIRLGLNLETAEALGLEISEAYLLTADDLVE